MSDYIRPRYFKILIAAGIIIALLPFLGIYTALKDYVFFVLGLVVAVLSYMMYASVSSQEKHPDAIHEEKAPEEIA